VRHYNRRRPHRALDLQAPDPISVPVPESESITSLTAVRRHDLLGGLIHEYQLAAAT
jgi:putative transposase